MTARRKHLYRVTAVWPAGPTGGAVTLTRCYQSKAAADHRAAVLRAGQPHRPDGHPEGPGQAAVPPAAEVTIERSEPVVWPSEAAA